MQSETIKIIQINRTSWHVYYGTELYTVNSKEQVAKIVLGILSGL